MNFPTSEQIRAARTLLGWSPYHLAKMAGITRPTIYKIDRSSGVPFSNLTTYVTIIETLEKAGVRFAADGVTLDLEVVNANNA